MKTFILTVVLALGFITICNAEDSVTTMPEKVVILGQELILKEQKGDVQQGYIAEYIPSDKTWDDWQLMYAVRLFPGENLDPKTAAQAQADFVKERQDGGDPVARGIVLSNDDGSSAVDFLLSEGNNPINVIEHNVWVFKKFNKGIVAYQIARRTYSVSSTKEEMQKLITDIPEIRSTIFKELANPPANPPFDLN